MSADLGDVFLKIYDKFGIIGLFGTLIMILAFLGTYEIIKLVATSILEKKAINIPFFKKKIYKDVEPLENHKFFEDLDRMINYEIYQMNIHCNLRKRIFTKLIKIRLTVVREVFSELTKIPTVTLETKDLLALIQTTRVKIKYEWRKQAEEAGIPQIVIDRFNEEMEVYFEIEDFLLTEDAENDMLPSNTHRLQNCLRTAAGMESRIFMALKNVIIQINGANG